jgi:hypothetical protein
MLKNFLDSDVNVLELWCALPRFIKVVLCLFVLVAVVSVSDVACNTGITCDLKKMAADRAARAEQDYRDSVVAAANQAAAQARAMSGQRHYEMSDYEYRRQADEARDAYNHEQYLQARENADHAWNDYFAARRKALGGD